MRMVRSGLSVTVSPSSAKLSRVASLGGAPPSSGGSYWSTSSGVRWPNRYSAKPIPGVWRLRKRTSPSPLCW